ncbi:class II peroxidase [Wolfiporia cocos MD-104 SS10]|uniref:Peroxidase n=1 Tax=Wolfiporia cocos (strain MD-104) TaxID=742152 RepID=A0A2H3JVD0_WOLCO|nr:class II peroxidase [Wolfiporia cocos MD-104 SS10]
MRACYLVLSLLAVFVAGMTQKAPECGRWYTILDEIQANLFNEGRCGNQAREAIRLTFHDGIGRSAALQASGRFGGGGADGSIIKFAHTELANPANDGLEDVVYALKHFADNHNVSYGDIIQFAGAVALSNCPGSPRLAFHFGRPQAIAPSPPNLVPSPSDSAEQLLARMEDAGFTADDTVALLAAHSLAVQRTIDPSIPGTPLDSTPGEFDAQFYLEMLLKGTAYPGKGHSSAEAKSPMKHEFRLASDAAVARHSSTACKWQSFIGDQRGLQASFRDAMLKLANQGFDDLVDCSDVIPIPRRSNRLLQYPTGKNYSDIEQFCPDVPFPGL